MNSKRGFFSSNPKVRRRFSVLYWIFALALAALIGVQSLFSWQLQKLADQNYGLWQAALFDCSGQEEQSLRSNPLIEHFGKQFLEGVVVQTDKKGADEESQEVQFGPVGWADAGFYGMANLSMKLGRLPEREDEIAVEAAALDSLGVSYTLNQPIRLPIRIDDQTVEERTFTLCGVVENYSSLWNSDGTLIRFFTSAPAETSVGSAAVHLFMQAKDGYEDVFRTISFDGHPLIVNENRRLSRDPFSEENRLITLLLLLDLVFCGLLVFETLLFWVVTHSHEIRLLRIFGIRKSVLCLDLLRMLTKASFWPCVFVLALSLLLHISFWLGIMLLGVFLFLQLVCAAFVSLYVLTVRPIPAIRGQAKDRNLSRSKRRRRTGKRSVKGDPVTIQNAAGRLFRSTKKSRLIVLAALCMLEMLCICGGVQILSDLKTIQNLSRFADYTLEDPGELTTRWKTEDAAGTPETRYADQNLKPIDSSVLQKLEQNGNLKIEFRTARDEDSSVRWKNQEQSLLYQTDPAPFTFGHPGALRPNKLGEWCAYLPVFQISQPEWIDRLKQTPMEGSVDWNRWQTGDQAIVYLPPLVQTQPGVLNASWNGQTDSTLSVGDELTVTSSDGSERTVKAAGIIRDPGWDFPFRTPYAVYTGGNETNYMEIKLLSQRNRLPVEIELSQTASQNGLRFTNNAAQAARDTARLKMRILTVFAFCLAGGLTALCVEELAFRKLQNELKAYQKTCGRIGVHREAIRQILHWYKHRFRLQCSLVCGLLLGVLMLILVPTPFQNVFPFERIAWCLGCGLLFSLIVSAAVILQKQKQYNLLNEVENHE